MAKPNSWITHVETFVDSSRPPKQQSASLDVLTACLKNGLLTIEALVREMEMYLTTSDNVIRARGILLLAELLTRLISKPLDDATVHSLIGFFTSRLADWQALRGALIGCVALLRRMSNAGVVISTDAKLLAQSYLQNLQVQSLAQHDRKLCFELLECLLARYPDAVATLGEDLVYGICEAIDEEKDPRCLMLTFHLVDILVQLFPDPFGPVANFAGDLFDILGRYFPIYFTHPKTNGIDVTRDELSLALMDAFTSTPFFEPYAIPLLLDKLSSSLPLAKLDSLKYLSNCTSQYGADRMAKHAKAIWSSLKDAICTSSQEILSSLTLVSPDDMGSQENELAKESLMCLQTILLEFDCSNDNLFLNFIVEDEDLEMIFKSVTSYKDYKDIPVESKRKLHALGRIISVSARVSTSCCSRLSENFLPRLMGILGISVGSFSSDLMSNENHVLSERLNFGALYLCLELLSSCRDLAVGTERVPSQSILVQDRWCCLLQNFSGPLAGVLISNLSTSKNQGSEEMGIYSTVRGLHILATFPGCFLPISKEICDNILMNSVSIITTRFEETFLWKLALTSLAQIGSFIEKFNDFEKGVRYMSIVVEKIVSWLSFSDSAMPLSLKLEAISEIGATGLNFMLRAVQGFEEAISVNFLRASVEGNLKSAESLVHLLESYSNQVLPWLHKIGGFEEVAMHFAVNIWNHMENITAFNICIQGQGLLDAAMMTMRLAVGGCTQENQALIVQKAYSILSLRTFFHEESMSSSTFIQLEDLQHTPDLVSFSCKDEWLISLFASVIIALCPQTPLPDIRVIFNWFTGFLLLKGHVPSAQAMGSMINKWPVKVNMTEVSSFCTLEEAIDMILEMCLWSVFGAGPRECDVINDNQKCPSNLSLNIGKNNLFQIHAMVGLAWIGKGLVMRGHAKAKEITMLLLKCLLSSSNMIMPLCQDQEGNDGVQDMLLLARSSADAFHVILSDSRVSLNKSFHATVRPLYKQHFFSRMSPILLSSIKECDSSNTRSMLYRAFGHVISETPLAVLVTDAKKLIPSLLDGLSTLSQEIANKDLTYSLLLVLSGILMDANGREAVAENAHIIVPHLIRLTTYPNMMLVRETAVQCLVAMSDLPHVRIYPMRTQVLQAISRALDDRKRSVRQEAVRCRQAWALIS